MDDPHCLARGSRNRALGVACDAEALSGHKHQVGSLSDPKDSVGLREHSTDPRHALFIVGYDHAMANLTVGVEPFKSAGWRLREQLRPSNVFAVFPHSPVVCAGECLDNGIQDGEAEDGMKKSLRFIDAKRRSRKIVHLDRGLETKW
jgi:hypothetical protein